LSKEEKTYVQEVIGTFLYYTRCVVASMLPALGMLATQEASPTKNTMKKIKQFLDFAATHPDAVVTYHATNTVLAGHSNATYLSKSNA
jgi:UDP-N-acetylglucosamine 2-epimerase